MKPNSKVRHVVIYVDQKDDKQDLRKALPLQSTLSGHCEVSRQTHQVTAGIQTRVGILLALNALYFCTALVFSQICHSICMLIDAYQSFFIVGGLFICMLDFKIPSANSSSARQTFSWGRVRLLGQVANMIFLLSLMFSQFVEAIQTIVHTSHEHNLHAPSYALAFGLTKFFLSILTFVVLRSAKVHRFSQSPHVLLLENQPRHNSSDNSFTARTMRFRNQSGRSLTNTISVAAGETPRTAKSFENITKHEKHSNLRGGVGQPGSMTEASGGVMKPDTKAITMHASNKPVELEALLSPAIRPPESIVNDDSQQTSPSSSGAGTYEDATVRTEFTALVSGENNSTTINKPNLIETSRPTSARDVIIPRSVTPAVISAGNKLVNNLDDGAAGDTLLFDGSEQVTKNPYERRHSYVGNSSPEEQQLADSSSPSSPRHFLCLNQNCFSSLYIVLNKWLNFISPTAVIASASVVLIWPGEAYHAYVRLADPIIALCLIAAICFAVVPSATELVFHLLLSVPKDIFAAGGVQRLRECVREQFPQILDVHSLRVWRHDPYNPESIVFTCHIVLEHPEHYESPPGFADELQRYVALLLGAYHAACMTIQPEFYPLARKLVVGKNKRYPCQSVCCEQSVRVRRRKTTSTTTAEPLGDDSKRDDVEANALTGLNSDDSAAIRLPRRNEKLSISSRVRTKSGSSRRSSSVTQEELEVAPLFSYSTYFQKIEAKHNKGSEDSKNKVVSAKVAEAGPSSAVSNN